MKDRPPALDEHTDDAEALYRELASINIRLGLTQRNCATLTVSEMPDLDRETLSAWRRRQGNEEIALIKTAAPFSSTIPHLQEPNQQDKHLSDS
jgi:hypothetical protein